MFYTVQCLVRWTAQSALQLTPWQTCWFRHQLGFSGKHSATLQLLHEDYSLTFQTLSISRYSFNKYSWVNWGIVENKNTLGSFEPAQQHLKGIQRNTKNSRWSLLSGVYARGSKRSHTGGKYVSCGGLHNYTRARDYKEIWSMDWCSTHDFVLNKQKTQKWWL